MEIACSEQCTMNMVTIGLGVFRGKKIAEIDELRYKEQMSIPCGNMHNKGFLEVV